MKKVTISKKQLDEALNVAVDVKNNDVRSSIQNAKHETERSVGGGKDINYVIPGGELNEEDEVTECGSSFTKKQMEEARIRTIKENNPCLTKKELTEMLKKQM